MAESTASTSKIHGEKHQSLTFLIRFHFIHSATVFLHAGLCDYTTVFVLVFN